MGFTGDSVVKNLHAMQEPQEMQVGSLGWEDPLEEGMATHSSILAWRIPWTEEPSSLRPWVHKKIVTEVTEHAPTHAGFLCTSENHWKEDSGILIEY